MARPRSPEKKESIRKAAIRIIAEEGFHNCTTDKIAEEAGVSVGTIYNYFTDKKDILAYIFKIEHKKLGKYFERVMKKDLAVPEKIKLLTKSYFRFVFNNKQLAQLIHDESSRTSEMLTQEIISYILAIRNHIKELLKDGIREGSVNSEYDLDMMVSLLLGSANAAVFHGYLKPDKIEYICSNAPDSLYKMLSEGIFVNDKSIDE
ncbi:MAG: TetR/AcrR family transcriptional regulator [Halanaerobiales bacterium]